MRAAIDPGNRCTAGGTAHSAANASGSASATAAGSRVPNRSSTLAGPAKARSIGNCWSSIMPISSANGDASSTASAAGSCAIR